MSFASQDWRLLVLAFFALLFVLLTVYRKFANRKVRDALLKVIPAEIEFVCADPAHFRGLDKDELARLTSEMEKLGFERLRDYTTRSPDKPAPRGFARLMVHRPERCFAEIMATSQAMAKNMSPRVAINSYLENDWDLGTSNVAPERGQYFLQLPQVLRMRYSDAEPAELWKRHLERRTEILEGLNIKPLSELSVDSYFQHIRKRMAERRQRMQSRQPIDELPAANALAAQRNYEWLGEFPKQRQRQPRQS